MTAFLQIPVSRVCLSRGLAKKEDENGDITRIPCLELFSILNVLFPHKTIGGKSRITYVLDFTDSKKVFWLNPMIYDLGILCFMPSTF